MKLAESETMWLLFTAWFYLVSVVVVLPASAYLIFGPPRVPRVPRAGADDQERPPRTCPPQTAEKG